MAPCVALVALMVQAMMLVAAVVAVMLQALMNALMLQAALHQPGLVALMLLVASPPLAEGQHLQRSPGKAR